MRYHIDTIPVWDAIKLDGECFLCALKRKTELGEVEHYLGASVMEPDTRIRVNKNGFCNNHQRMLYAVDNRLGHALMLESHVAETRERLAKACKEIKHAAKGASTGSIIDRLTGKAPSPSKMLEDAAGSLEAQPANASSMVRASSIAINFFIFILLFGIDLHNA